MRSLETGNRAGLLLGALFLSGCGGGGGTGTGAGPAGGTQEMVIGGLITRVAGTTQPPLTQSGQGAVVTGIAGGTISSLAYAAPAATPANSAVTLAQTRITFDRRGQIYTMGSDGANPTALTTSLSAYYNALSPAWSPDGTKIAFVRYDPTATNYLQIYTVLANGAGMARVSDGTTIDYTPAWSPDGSKIAFMRFRADVSRFQIGVMGANGASPHIISDGTADDYAPAWSPDGSKIAFMRHDSGVGHYQIYTMTPTGGSVKNVTSFLTSYDLADPAWSPDGARIAFSSNLGDKSSHIYTVRADGAGYEAVTTAATANDSNPTYSPDSTKIAFQRQDAGAGPQIYFINAIGTGEHRISDGQAIDLSPHWGPYVKARKFVGAGGAFGATASGFLVGRQDKAITGLVVFNAKTPNTAHLDVQGTTLPYQPNLVFAVSADLLTSLSYVNGITNPPTTVLSASSTATGALVSFSADDGTVADVFPYTANKAQGHDRPAPERSGDTLTYRASFLGIWDSAGRNRAPGGAREIQIDGRTGQLISFQ